MLPVALTVAGSDPSGGAGIAADLKTFTQFRVYGAAAITLVTVQNTTSVSRVEVLSPDLVRQQIEAVLSDLPVAAIKTGALGSAEMVEEIAELSSTFGCPLIVDPVMISKHGAPLLPDCGIQIIRERLLPRSYLVTPNIPEAEALAGFSIASQADTERAALAIQKLGCPNVLVKGGHVSGEPDDVLAHADGINRFKGHRVNTPHTHGTGCTYSAAITAGLAHGLPLLETVTQAKRYIQEAIETAPGFGRGHGPVNHLLSPTESCTCSSTGQRLTPRAKE